MVEVTVRVTDNSVKPAWKTTFGNKISARRIATRELQFVSQPGCYSLVIELKQRKKIQVGKLGKGEFQPGTYVYTGSAMGGLRARLLRHLSGTKKMRWHIDYFLNNEQATVKRILSLSRCSRSRMPAEPKDRSDSWRTVRATQVWRLGL